MLDSLRYLTRCIVILLVIMPIIATAQDRPRLAVLDLKPGKDIEIEEALTLTGKLSTYIHETGAFRLINRGDIESILENHAIEIALCDEDACLLRVGMLLGAEKLIVGDVGELWGKFNLNIRLVDVVGMSLENEVMLTRAFLPENHERVLRDLASKLAGLDTSREPDPVEGQDKGRNPTIPIERSEDDEVASPSLAELQRRKVDSEKRKKDERIQNFIDSIDKSALRRKARDVMREDKEMRGKIKRSMYIGVPLYGGLGYLLRWNTTEGVNDTRRTFGAVSYGIVALACVIAPFSWHEHSRSEDEIYQQLYEEKVDQIRLQIAEFPLMELQLAAGWRRVEGGASFDATSLIGPRTGDLNQYELSIRYSF